MRSVKTSSGWRPSDSGAKSPTQNQTDLSQSLAFEGHEQSLRPTGPEVEVEANERSLESSEAEARRKLATLIRRSFS